MDHQEQKTGGTCWVESQAEMQNSKLRKTIHQIQIHSKILAFKTLPNNSIYFPDKTWIFITT